MSDWISHVKKYAAVNGIPYKQALKEAAASYKKGGCKKCKYDESESESSYEEYVESDPSEEETESDYSSDYSNDDSSEYSE